MIFRAAAYATEMHGDQKRKYTGEPYVCHCFDVAGIVASVTSSPAMLAAAILHDTVEDTAATLDDIQDIFGPHVENLVMWLTDASRPEDGNRAARKKIDRDFLAQAPAYAQTIKLADLISNTRSIVKYDPGFAKVYLPEKQALLEVLTRGDGKLWGIAKGLVETGLRAIDSPM